MSFFSLRKSQLVLCLLHLALAVPLAYALNVWLDEAWTMQTTAHGPRFAWTHALSDERQAPLYFVLASLVQSAGGELFAVRLLSVAFSLGTIALIPSLVKRYAPNVPAWAVTLIIALHPYLVWASLEARPYALVILLSALLLRFFYDGYLSDAPQSQAQLFYCACAVCALYTNYYLGFLLFAGACSLAALRRGRMACRYVVQMIAVGVVFAPLVVAVKQQMAVNSDYFFQRPPLSEAVSGVWWKLQAFWLPLAETANRAEVLRVWGLRLFFGGLVVWTIAKIYHGAAFPQIMRGLGVMVGVSGLFYAAMYLAAGAVYVQPRHWAVVFVPATLLGAGWAVFLNRRRGWVIWLLLLGLCVPMQFFRDYVPLAKNGDWQRVATFIEQHETAGQPITTFYLYDTIPLRFSYRGINAIVPAEVTHDWNHEAAPGSPQRYARQIAFLIAQIPPQHEKLWLVTHDKCNLVPLTQNECAPLNEWLAQHYEVELSQQFYGRQVRLLRRTNRLANVP